MATESASGTETQPEVKRGTFTTAPGDLDILLVDDEKMVLDFMSGLLEGDGYRCRRASSGAEALEAVKERSPDLVISDIRMPNMSGVELAAAVIELNPEILVVLVTGYAEYETVSAAIQQRPFGYLEKPFGIEDMRDIVHRARAAVEERRREEEEHRELESAVTEKTRELEFRTERLLAEKEMLHGIISSANFGLLAVDTLRTVHLANPYAMELLRNDSAASAQVVGLSIDEAIPDHFSPKFSELYQRACSRDENDSQNPSLSLTLDHRKLDVIAYPISYRDRVTAVVFIIHDTTEKEQLQQRLLQTAKLASIGELAAGVAHEINNPLAFVTSNCNTLVEYLASLRQYVGFAEDEAKKQGESSAIAAAFAGKQKELDVEYILEDCEVMMTETIDGLGRVSKIVRDLKAFARVEQDTPQAAQVNSVIDDALNLVRNETKYKLEVVREFGELPELDCFPNQLVQVLTNLFINATHAIEDKGTLTITTEHVKDNIRIKVGDTGSGIPEAIRSRIFDPFFTTKEPGKGTGMGLSISFGIIERHGGTLEVESEMGQGTTFTINLPLKTAASTATGTEEPQSDQKGRF